MVIKNVNKFIHFKKLSHSNKCSRVKVKGSLSTADDDYEMSGSIMVFRTECK